MPLEKEAESVPDSDENAGGTIVEYPEWATHDEVRRAFVVRHMASADIDGPVLVANMETVFQWLKTGEVPGQRKASLKQIRGERGDTAP